VAQTGQFFDLYHRPGNFHDSNGAAHFMLECFENAKAALNTANIESRVDAAFFNQDVFSVFNLKFPVFYRGGHYGGHRTHLYFSMITAG